MQLAARLKAIEAKLALDDQEPQLVIVIEDEDGTWRDGQGNQIDPATIAPWVRVIRLVKRQDGPQ